MIVKVRLSGIFTEGHPQTSAGDPESVRLADSADVKELLRILNIPKPGQAVAVSKGRVLQHDRQLKEGDRITIFPVVGGG